MKKLQVILGENEAQITMELTEVVAAQLFKDMSDKMFAEKYGVSSFIGEQGCCISQVKNIGKGERIKIKKGLGPTAPVVEPVATHEPVPDHTEETMENLMTLVDKSLEAMNHKREVEDRVYHLPMDKRGVALVRCPGCKSKFFTRASKGDEVICRCGEHIDTNKTFMRGEYSCKRCSTYFVFFADESIDKYNAKCSDCESSISLKFDKQRHSLDNH